MEGDVAGIVRQWFARFSEGDPGVDLCSPEIRIDNLVEFPITGPYHGHDGVRRWWGDLRDAIDDMRVELEKLEELDGERALTRQRIVGRFRHTGIDVDARWAAIISVRDGLIVGAVGYASRREALRASSGAR